MTFGQHCRRNANHQEDQNCHRDPRTYRLISVACSAIPALVDSHRECTSDQQENPSEEYDHQDARLGAQDEIPHRIRAATFRTAPTVDLTCFEGRLRRLRLWCFVGVHISHRTLMWMQPAPAHHLGPMRTRLREPAWINPLCRVASHALFGLGGWGPGPPHFVERPDPAESGPPRQAKSPGRPENHRRALAGRPGAASGKSARLMPNSPPPATPPSSRGSWPRANRIKSAALAAGRHAGPGQVEGSRGRCATGQEPVARQSDIGQRN